MIARLLLAASLLAGLLLELRHLAGRHGALDLGLAALSAGFLLLSAWVGGRGARFLGLPRVTGYLAVGALVGPYALGLLRPEMLVHLRPLSDAAIAFIALLAGVEMRLETLRRHLRSILTVALVCTALVFSVVAVAQLSMPGLLPYMEGHAGTEALVIALLVAAVCVTMSPMVTMAAIKETGSRGPLSSVLLGTTVAVDLVVIVLFAVVMSVGQATFAAEAAGGGSVVGAVAWKLGGSLGAGLAAGGLLSLLLERTRLPAPLLLVVAAASVSLASGALGVDRLLTALTAGFLVINTRPATTTGRVDQAMHRLSMPVFALFFALAGAKIDLGLLGDIWYAALLLVLLRSVSMVAGGVLGTTLAGSRPQVRRYLWMGFVSQAGISLAMAAVIGESFAWGAEVEAILIGMVVIHEIVGPLAATRALRRAGEAGRVPLPGASPALPEPPRSRETAAEGATTHA